MKGYLRVGVGRDGSDDCEVFVDFRSGPYAGCGSAWFNFAEVEGFAKGLSAYPIQAAVELRGGFWNSTERRIEHEHLYLAVYPIGLAGRIGVKVRATTPIHRDDRVEQKHSAEIELQTEYEQIRRFSSSLLDVIHGRSAEAELEGNGL